jgi:hypothetical protein
MDNENHFQLLDTYVAVKAGEPYRILPFGPIRRGGKERMITPEFAAMFRLPHFKPPIKIGSHADETPSGGSIIGLEVREDGLYAINEMTERGQQAMNDGSYRYHSPEIIWGGMGIEGATTGNVIEGPLIVGDALLHAPALGERAALYQTEIVQKEVNVMEHEKTEQVETVQVPVKIWDKFTAWLDKAFTPPEVTPEAEPEQPAENQEPDKFEAMQAELVALKAEKDAREKAEADAKLKAEIVAELKSDKYGSAYVEVKTAEEAASVLSGMSPEQREWVMRNFAAQLAQVKESALLEERGSTGKGPDEKPVQALSARIEAVKLEKKLSYTDAYNVVLAETPELVKAAYPGR